MISRAPYNLELTSAELKHLLSLRDWHGNMWDKPPDDTVKDIKSKIRTQLEDVQNKCSYCGLRLKGTSKGDIEHIAPKAYYRCPQFTFTLKNLTLACDYCNKQKKGTKPTIDGDPHRLYARCVFLIVHPYFDDPDAHYDWVDQDTKILIQHKPDSTKGSNSITMFGLDDTDMAELRAAQVRHEELVSKSQLSQDDEELLNEALE